jgi:hypothetical protein
MGGRFPEWPDEFVAVRIETGSSPFGRTSHVGRSAANEGLAIRKQPSKRRKIRIHVLVGGRYCRA